MSDFELQPKRSDAIEKAASESVPVTGQEASPFFKQLKGFWVTFSTMFKKPLVVEYPEVKVMRVGMSCGCDLC
jgi:NADH-quinone oxidoreductase subunit I